MASLWNKIKYTHCSKGAFKDRYIIVASAVVLFILFAWNIPNICTIWEIPDEAGYLYNAALWTGQPWNEAFSNLTAYYGYGYSVFLIPLFFICDSGVMLIRGAILVNVFFIVGIYFLQFYFMTRFFSNAKRGLCVAVSLVLCGYPYLICNCYKVDSETCLYFFLLLTALLLYKAVDTRKTRYYFSFSLAMIYMYFVHARALVIIASALVVLFYLACKKIISAKKLIITILCMAASFAVLYLIKNDILSILGTGILVSEATSEVGNVFTVSYFTDRLRWLIADIGIYFVQGMAKVFYLIVSTMGLVVWGVVYLICQIRGQIHNHMAMDGKTIVQMFFLISFVLMVIAAIISSVGNTYAYVYYGRYYEFTVIPVVLIGIGSFFEGKYSHKVLVTSLLLTMVSFFFSLYMESYIGADEIGIDTNRLSGITYAIQESDSQYLQTISLLLKLTMLFLIVCFVLNQSKWRNVLLCVFIGICFYQTDHCNVAQINQVNQDSIADTELAEYVAAHITDEEIYFVYEPYRYDFFYLRVQVLIKDYPIHIIYPEDVGQIKEDSYIITFSGGEACAEFMEDDELMHTQSGARYELFIKE